MNVQLLSEKAKSQKTRLQEKEMESICTQSAQIDAQVEEIEEIIKPKPCTKAEPQKIMQVHFLEKVEEEKAKEQTLKEKKNALQQIADRMTEKDYATLMKEGKIEKAYDVVRLERAMDRVKEGLAEREIQAKTQAEQQQQQQEQIKQVAVQQASENKREEQIAKKLEEQDIPVTRENIACVMQQMEQVKGLGIISEHAAKYLLKNQLPFSIEMVYQAQHSGPMKENISQNKDWELLEDQVLQHVKDLGLEQTEETIGAAKWLLENEIPVQTEQISYLKQIEVWNTLVQKGQIPEEDIAERIFDAMRKGKGIGEAVLLDPIEDRVKKAISVIQKADDMTIWLATRETPEVSLSLLEEIEEKKPQSQSFVIQEQQADPFIKAKRQIEEIRLKMTLEAGRRMIQKGIYLETESLQKIVEELKRQEKEQYVKLMQEDGVDLEEAKADTLQETMRCMEKCKSIPHVVLGKTLQTKETETIQTLVEKGLALKEKMRRANESYEPLQTSIRKDLGDSLQKAWNSIDAILEETGLENTMANRRAVQILSYQGIEPSKEQIDAVKWYDVQLQFILKNLSPKTAGEMIQSGEHPLELPIENLYEKLQEMQGDGEEERESYGAYLWKLGKNNQLTEEEKEAYLGLYRLFYQIEKTDGAALSAVYRAGQEMTLQNLLTATRTLKKKGIDETIDQDFGVLEGIKRERKTISEQIAGYHVKEETGERYQRHLAKNIKNELAPEKLKQMIKETNYEDFLDISLEQLSEQLEQQGDTLEDQAYREEILQRIKNLAENKERVMEFLKEADEIEEGSICSLEKIEAAEQFLQNEAQYYNICKKIFKQEEQSLKLLQQFPEKLSGKQSMLQQYQKLQQKIEEVFEKEWDKTDLHYEELQSMKQLENGIKQIVQYAKEENYRIPLFVGERITNLKIKIRRNEQESGRIEMHLSSKQLGEIEANVKVCKDQANVCFYCEKRDGLDELQREENRLRENLQQANVMLENCRYYVNTATQIRVGDYEKREKEARDQVSTKQLYKIAKAMVFFAKEVEQRQQPEEEKGGRIHEN